MADTFTANLGILIADLNDVISFGPQAQAGFTTIDGLMGAVQCTSGSRPTNTYAGQIIYETDSKRYAQNTGTKVSPAWTYMSHQAYAAASSARPTVGLTAGELLYETDNGLVRPRGSSAWLSNIPTCTSSARPANPVTGDLAVETDTNRLIQWNGSAWMQKAFSTFVCTSSTHPGSPFQGLTIYETDTGRTLIYNGSNYVPTGRQIMAAPISTASNGTSSSGTTETFDAVLGYYQCSTVTGRRYEVKMNGLALSGTVANDLYRVLIRRSGSSSNPTSSSTLIASAQYLVTNTGGPGQQTVAIAGSFLGGVTGTDTFGMSLTRIGGSGAGQPINLGASRELFVDDAGAAY